MIIYIGCLVNNTSFFILFVYADWSGVAKCSINLTCSMYLLISTESYKEIILFFGHHKFLCTSPGLMYSFGILTQAAFCLTNVWT